MVDVKNHEFQEVLFGLELFGQLLEETTVAKNDLENSEKEYRELVDRSRAMISVHDEQGIIYSINSQVANFLGYNAKDIIGKNLKAFLHSEYVPLFDDYIEEILENKYATGVTAIKSSSGEIIYWSYQNVVRQMFEGLRIICYAQDITDRILLEKELREAKELTEEALQFKEQFVANISHEIRTPMNAILGLADIVSKSNLSEVQRENIDLIKLAGENLLAIINDVLDISKIESGGLQLHVEPVELKTMISFIKNLLIGHANKKGIDLILSLDENLPEVVATDKVRLNQVLVNLVGNAIKFTDKGGVELKVNLIDKKENKIKVIFEIIDTGIGISQDKIESIFDRFVQIENYSTKNSVQGTGLGLSISKSIISLLGGELKVESEINKGSKFSFELILNTTEKKSENIELQHQLTKLQGKKALVVDDSELNRVIARKILNGNNIEVQLVENGQKAIECLCNSAFDFILMDVQMPEMDGYETTQKIRETGNEIPIIALTAHSMEGEKMKCIKSGMNDYISKPYTEQELIQVINKNIISIYSDSLVDLSSLKKLSSGDKNFENELVQIYLSSVPVELDKMKQSLQQNDVVALNKIAHKLKSTFNTFGIKRAVELTNVIENVSEISPNVDIASQIVELTKIFNKSKEQLTH